MRRSIKYIIAISIVLLAVIGIILGIHAKYERNAEGIRAIMVQGLIASWEYIERDISLDYFYQLDNTTTYRQIVEEIGEPNGGRGSGLVLPYWQIDNNLFAVMSFAMDKDGEYAKAFCVYISDREKTLDVIYLE